MMVARILLLYLYSNRKEESIKKVMPLPLGIVTHKLHALLLLIFHCLGLSHMSILAARMSEKVVFIKGRQVIAKNQKFYD